MKICVTGGAGFIASHIVDAYVEAGHDVVVIDDLSTGSRDNLNPRARFLELDIQSTEIGDVFQQEKFDLLNHHAAQMSVQHSVRDPIDDAERNVIGSLRCFQSAIAAGVKKIIFASSAGTVYGEQLVPLCDETHATQPLSPYGASKVSVEHYLHALHACHGIPYLAFRYSNIYGPRQSPHGEAGVIAIFLAKMLKHEKITINGDGLQTRDYLFIEDVVRANLQGLDDNVVGVYNIVSAKETSVVGIVEALEAATGITADSQHVTIPHGEPRRGCYSFAKAQRDFGWKPTVGIDDGLRRTAEELRSTIQLRR